MKKRLTVTIGIPAHNEEKNIGKLLNSILAQKGDFYILEEVLVACDGCVDKTLEIVKKYSVDHSFIKSISDGLRLGKSGRLNQLYKISQSDVFIAFDGDVFCGDQNAIEEIAKYFVNEKVGLAGGRDMPCAPKKFFEKIVAAGDMLWYETRKSIDSGQTIHNHHGCVSAMAKSLYRQVEIPKDMAGDDDYLYFRAKELGFEFKFAQKAIVYYKAPDNLNDFLLQSSRFLFLKDKIAEHFGAWAYEEYKVPVCYKIKGILTVFLRDPIYLFLAAGLQVFLRLFKNKFKKTYNNDYWTTINSTK